MKITNGAILLLCLVATDLVTVTAQTFQTLGSFDGPNGIEPFYMSPVQGTDGNLYGTTYAGGILNCVSKFGCGTVFKVTGNKLASLYKFHCQKSNCSEGLFLWSGLVLATDGNFYGVTENGGPFKNCVLGCGTLFRITRDGKLTTIYSFCSLQNCEDGANPLAPLIQGSDGYLYGTTNAGGAYQGGTIFKISMTGAVTALYSFGCSGCSPGIGPLVQGQDGDFYGTAGNGLFGTIFKVSPSGRFTTLYTFCSQANCADGNGAQALLLATDSNFYGATPFGGLKNCGNYQGGGCGTVFKMTPAGKFSTLYRFCEQSDCADGATPWAGLIQATDGALYGTTSEGGDLGNPKCAAQVVGCGTIFRFMSTGSLETVYRFDSPSDGYQPTGGLVQRTNGDFYGTTQYGGNGGENYGTVFRLSTGLQPFVAFVRSSGKVGHSSGILGQGFTGATSVSFNGIFAKFTVISDTFVKATVPSGATTGYVSVTTSSGKLTSNVPFRVLP